MVKLKSILLLPALFVLSTSYKVNYVNGRYKVKAASRELCTLNFTINDEHRQMILHPGHPSETLFDNESNEKTFLQVAVNGTTVPEMSLRIEATSIPQHFFEKLGNCTVSLMVTLECAEQYAGPMCIYDPGPPSYWPPDEEDEFDEENTTIAPTTTLAPITTTTTTMQPEITMTPNATQEPISELDKIDFASYLPLLKTLFFGLLLIIAIVGTVLTIYTLIRQLIELLRWFGRPQAE